MDGVLLMGRKALAWLGGVLAGVAAIVLLIDQITFDHEVDAAEKRILRQTGATQEKILNQLLIQQQAQTAQSQQQFYTLRVEFLEAEVERLQDKLLVTGAPHQWWIQERIQRAQGRLDEMRQKLDELILNASP